MAEASAHEAQLVAQVTESLSMHLMDNARFMAERLHAEFPSEVRTLFKPDAPTAACQAIYSFGSYDSLAWTLIGRAAGVLGRAFPTPSWQH